MIKYDLTSVLGAYLFRESNFNPRGLVGAMALEVLDAYFDTSGKQLLSENKIIMVAGCVGLPSAWVAFDKEWQEVLKAERFKLYKDTGRYVFHTTDYHANQCKYMPDNLTPKEKQRIYRRLINVIITHSVFRLGYGVILADYKKFWDKYPFVAQNLYGQPGTFISVLAAGKVRDWAVRNNYSPTFAQIHDRGDEFWGQMRSEFDAFVAKDPLAEELQMGTLTCANKVQFSPLQAADIVAWECRKYFAKFVRSRINLAGVRLQYELDLLRTPHIKDSAFFTVFEYPDLEQRFKDTAHVSFRQGNISDILEAEEALKQEWTKRHEKLQARKERRDAKRQQAQGNERV